MGVERSAPDTRGVNVQLLATLDPGPGIEGVAGRLLRKRSVTIDPGGVFGPLHDHEDRPGLVCIPPGTITGAASRPTTARVSAGPRTGIRCTGGRTEGRSRRWRFRSTSSGSRRRCR